jgi:hypothetical protein
MIASVGKLAGGCAVWGAKGRLHAESEISNAISAMRQYGGRFWKGIEDILLSLAFFM